MTGADSVQALVPGAAATGTAAQLIGRDSELALLRQCVVPQEDDAGQAVLLVAEAGVGKTALLDATATQAAQAGRRILRVRGTRGEADLAFAGLHQLLWPVLSRAESLAPRQRHALQAAFGLQDDAQPHVPDRLLLGLATLTLLSDLAAEKPLLIVVDDAHWVDSGSLDVLSFLARRLEGESISVLAACRTEAAPELLSHAMQAIAVGPLDETAAHALLDAQPTAPTGRHRTRIVQCANGNPLALVELARCTDPDQLTTAPLPISRRLEDLYAAQLTALPSATRTVLLLAAAADAPDLSMVLGIVPEAADPATWQHAEHADLIRISGRSITFRHPLIRSAVYQAASQPERRQAHLHLAEALSHDFDRRAWHLAAAAFGPDDDAAAALDKTAERAISRGATESAATALEQAASLSGTPLQQAQRLMKAAGVLAVDDHVERAGELAARAAHITADDGLRRQAEMLRGWVLSAGLRQSEAFTHLMATARSLARADPEAALQALAVGAAVANHAGVDAHRQQVDEALNRMLFADGLPRLWVSTAVNPLTRRPEALAAVREALAPRPPDSPPHSPREQIWLSGMAWLLDETSAAIHFGRACDPLAHDRPEFRNRQMALTYGWACLEHGWWTHTRAVIDEANAAAATRPFGRAEVYVMTLEANLCALQGDTDRAHHLTGQVFDLVDAEPVRQIRARTHWATGLAHAATDDHEAAFAALRRMFHPDATPLHFHASPYAIADLAEAAVRSGHTEGARPLLTHLLESLPAERSARLNGRLLHAQALLDDSGRADDLFCAALTDDQLAPWPFEHAQTTLAHGQWLRRNGRINDARAPLNHALETFQRLGAAPWAARAAAELRASGVTLHAPASDALNDLSAQQQQIVRLAAEGMTNREIGERLFLSPRTVGHHLYRVFPKLGITSRHQLRDLIGGDGPGR
ncbi:transcriptional regulator [Streptomyces davaonensis JCM 4913]|uniref:Transcriptional regulator n=1 Tax=Streptomyces davaonensis (strain DSM 101723 / JCM 4913 / KCC S-0913 / 768) TaxID=1214101 RepID=K4QXU0_STRDJ|nr:LuxR family transcriptional regulator [Streptomyces davaonensis]CCK28846.1 transcriptional regulator [Streptomyces davaonensis JCM 4913]